MKTYKIFNVTTWEWETHIADIVYMSRLRRATIKLEVAKFIKQKEAERMDYALGG